MILNVKAPIIHRVRKTIPSKTLFDVCSFSRFELHTLHIKVMANGLVGWNIICTSEQINCRSLNTIMNTCPKRIGWHDFMERFGNFSSRLLEGCWGNGDQTEHSFYMNTPFTQTKQEKHTFRKGRNVYFSDLNVNIFNDALSANQLSDNNGPYKNVQEIRG